jgi:flagellin
MRINTNISSISAQEAAQNTNNAMKSSLDKLSTGLRINKASDDASGLAIADKLRTQANSVGQGISNGNSAVALLQIADKSMAEQSNILDTVKAKLIQANTDTTSEAGRESIRKDISKLLSQLDNIAAQTNYNGKSLLADVVDGQLTGKEAASLNFQIGANTSDIISTEKINSSTTSLGGGSAILGSIDADSTEMVQNVKGGDVSLASTSGGTLDVNVSGNLGKVTSDAANALTFVVDPADEETIAALKAIASESTTDGFAKDTTYDNVFKLDAGTEVDLFKVALNNVQITGAGANLGFKSDSDSFKVSNNDLTKSVDVSLEQAVAKGESTTVTSTDTQKDLTVQSTGTSVNAVVSGNLGSMTVGAADVTIEATNAEDVAALQKLIDDGDTNVTRSGDKFTFANGQNYDLSAIDLKDAKVTATVVKETDVFTSTTSSAVTIKNNSDNELSISNIDASSGENLSSLKNLGEGELTQAVAADFQAVVDDAITQLNGYRGDIGSTQNQVESAVRNLNTQQTNIKAAESIIRDVDYAAESANFNKQNIISQAGAYAISQANAMQQNVLRLLQ